MSAQPGNILFLHHSTGNCVLKGGVQEWIAEYDRAHGKGLRLSERSFPNGKPYGWKNYPYDYWNIWVKNAGSAPYQEEPTLEMLTQEYGLIVIKHCFPVSAIQPDAAQSDVASEQKTLGNYKLQYAALKAKMRSFPKTRFLVWTPAALTEASTSEAEARRAADFSTWVRDIWDEPGDNIFVWDFHAIETEAGLYLKPEYAAGTKDSHPNEALSRIAAPMFAQRMVDVIEGRGDKPKRP